MSHDVFVIIEHLRGKVSDISYVMLAAARSIASATNGKVIAVLLGHDAESLARDLAADRVLYIEHAAFADFSSDAYQRTLENLIKEHAPRAVLFGDTTIGGDVAAWLSTRLNLPLVSACRTLRADDGTLKFVSQICGGKMMAEGDLPAPTALVMMVPGGYKPEQGRAAQPPEIARVDAPALADLRVATKGYIEPAVGDVDISKEPILVSIGRGIQNQDNIELAEDLAKALGGVVAGSRPVIDQGWLSSTRLVGKSGKAVKPKLYLALGISGAPEHVEAIGDSEMIIAINTDPNAPIFSLAKYGAQMDILDLMPVLTEKVQQARG
ncbi:MAG: electron transfer flavoprotein subunit alpha/FixB family protein [Anaerolineae bacterium]|nr:electron transfer flavoprotein subunit alpha/FixB family protein [Anaerolineae bacterium]